MIIKCSCSHKAQDKMYGRGMRVHNYARKGFSDKPGWRCTVCEDIKPMSTSLEIDMQEK